MCAVISSSTTEPKANAANYPQFHRPQPLALQGAGTRAQRCPRTALGGPQQPQLGAALHPPGTLHVFTSYFTFALSCCSHSEDLLPLGLQSALHRVSHDAIYKQPERLSLVLTEPPLL